MSFEIRELSSTLCLARWIVMFYRGTEDLTHSFQLKSSAMQYTLKCVYVRGDPSGRIVLCLESKKTPAQKLATASDERDSAGDNNVSCNMKNYSLARVWANINDGEDQALTLRENKEWKSEEICVVDLDHYGVPYDGWGEHYEDRDDGWGGHYDDDDYGEPMQLSIRICLKFEEVSGGNLKVLSDLSNLFLKQAHCDVHFQLPLNKKIGAHLCVLCARSPVFEAMFQHGMKESETKTIVVSDVEEDILKEFLHYLYAGMTLRDLTDITAQPLYEVAHKYDVDTLREECIAYLLLNISVTNATNWLVWSDTYKIDELRQATLKFISEHAKQICSSPEWVTFAETYPRLSVEVTRKIVEGK